MPFSNETRVLILLSGKNRTIVFPERSLAAPAFCLSLSAKAKICTASCRVKSFKCMKCFMAQLPEVFLLGCLFYGTGTILSSGLGSKKVRSASRFHDLLYSTCKIGPFSLTRNQSDKPEAVLLPSFQYAERKTICMERQTNSRRTKNGLSCAAFHAFSAPWVLAYSH